MRKEFGNNLPILPHILVYVQHGQPRNVTLDSHNGRPSSVDLSTQDSRKDTQPGLWTLVHGTV